MASNSGNNIWLSLDIKSMENYQVALLKAQAELPLFTTRFLNTLAGMILERVIPITPVKTTVMKKSWRVSAIKIKSGNTTEITVFNDARQDGQDISYASYVEFGHFTRNKIQTERRWIEGRFILTVATDEVEAEMTRVWNEMFADWVKGVGL